MYFLELFILSSCISSSICFFGLGHDNGFFTKEFNVSMGLFEAALIPTKWIRQPLDHFDAQETRTWNMRYFERLDLWRPKGPIYLFINGEWTASKGFLQSGIMYDLAKETKGAMYSSEHRYYGKSMPFKNLTTENLAYLSSRQALADVARLLKRIKLNPLFFNSKVVVVGGSYSGNLAAWMKVLYPDLVDAALASSAPVLAKKDFYEYLENVGEDFEQYGADNCYDKIMEVFKRYEDLFKTSSGIAQIKEEEEICDSTDMTKSENKQLFFLEKASALMSESQYGTPESIERYCNKLMNTSSVYSIKDEEGDLWNERDNCFDYDLDSYVQDVKNIDWYLSWTYQTCTEFGYFPTTTNNRHPFTDNIHGDLFYSICSKTFGPEFDENRVDESILHTNDMYGGLEPNVTNVVFVNGDLDPWHRLGVLEDISYKAPAKVIPRVSHCRDLLPDRKQDPEELREARKYIKYVIKDWIGAGDYLSKN